MVYPTLCDASDVVEAHEGRPSARKLNAGSLHLSQVVPTTALSDGRKQRALQTQIWRMLNGRKMQSERRKLEFQEGGMGAYATKV